MSMKKIHHDSAPTLIPHVVLDVYPDGMSSGPWRQSSPGQIIDPATPSQPTPARAGIHEGNRTVTGSRRSPAQDPTTAIEETVGTADHAAFAKIEETGFVPGEDVAVAIVFGHTEAGPTGMARAILDPARLGAGEVVLFGRTSGTLAIRPLP